MDLQVSQSAGCRYVSCVPIDGWRLLVSDNCYTDTPEVDYAAMAKRIEEYCLLANWQVAEVQHEQREVLPVVAAGDFDAFWASGEGGVARLGMWAGLTHPLTGSELGPTVIAALRLAELGAELSGPALARASRRIASEHWRYAGFGRFLARLMFAAARERRRYKVFERIFHMDDLLIERVFASSLRFRDRITLLNGRLPVPLGRALATIFGGGFPLVPLDAMAPSQDLPA
jgi:lycopene beta-cyclase